MNKKAKSAKPSKPSKKASKRNLGDLILNGLEEGIAHARGQTQLRTRTVEVPAYVDVRAVRENSGLSQSEFAARYGFSLRTLQEWEQGRAQPDSAVRAYLLVIDRDPQAVQAALAS
jgi:putative transcriptional regulator